MYIEGKIKVSYIKKNWQTMDRKWGLREKCKNEMGFGRYGDKSTQVEIKSTKTEEKGKLMMKVWIRECCEYLDFNKKDRLLWKNCHLTRRKAQCINVSRNGRKPEYRHAVVGRVSRMRMLFSRILTALAFLSSMCTFRRIHFCYRVFFAICK